MHDEPPSVVTAPALPDENPVDQQDHAGAETIPEEIYAAVAPMLLRVLCKPLTAKEVVERTELPKTLVAQWLKRLVDERRAVKVKTRYHAADLPRVGSEQPSLF